jgi:hypothetical protein
MKITEKCSVLSFVCRLPYFEIMEINIVRTVALWILRRDGLHYVEECDIIKNYKGLNLFRFQIVMIIQDLKISRVSRSVYLTLPASRATRTYT